MKHDARCPFYFCLLQTKSPFEKGGRPPGLSPTAAMNVMADAVSMLSSTNVQSSNLLPSTSASSNLLPSTSASSNLLSSTYNLLPFSSSSYVLPPKPSDMQGMMMQTLVKVYDFNNLKKVILRMRQMMEVKALGLGSNCVSKGKLMEVLATSPAIRSLYRNNVDIVGYLEPGEDSPVGGKSYFFNVTPNALFFIECHAKCPFCACHAGCPFVSMSRRMPFFFIVTPDALFFLNVTPDAFLF